MKRSAATPKRGQFGPAKAPASALGTHEFRTDLMLFVILYQSIMSKYKDLSFFYLF